jgi:hypothetical protein
MTHRHRHIVLFRICIVAFLTVSSPQNSRAQSATPSASSISYEGTIGKSAVRVMLQPKNDILIGTYKYLKIGKDLELQGMSHGKDSVILKEFDEQERQTGLFKGRYVGKIKRTDSIIGVWSRPDGSRSLPFKLRALASPTKQSVAETAAGRYKREGKHGAEINVQHLGNNLLRIEGEAFWVGQNDNVHTGDIGGTCKIEGIVAMYADTTMPDCRLQLTFGNATLSVYGDKGECGGMNVTFNGTYKRVAAKPIFRERKN